MADPVFERYKEALKQGHMAMLQGRHKEALAQYQEAAGLADHRALPFVSMGSVLLQMGRPQDAIAAYDQALQRAPTDPQALSGKASALLAAGRRDESADLTQQVARLEADQARERAEQKASAQAAAWTGGPERLIAAAETARHDGHRDGAIEGFVAAAQGYQQLGQLDAALDACQRALGVSLGAPAAHLQMARIYFQRGWRDRGVERLLLLARLLTLTDDPATRDGVRELARLHQASESRLAVIAAGNVI
jgi:tetratricopeptide (TPR) repeat protein